MLRRLLEFPSREGLLRVLEQELLPSIARDQEATERAAGRRMGFDAVGETRAFVDHWRDRPLAELAAHGQYRVWAWMEKNAEFCERMLDDAMRPWWREARQLVRHRFESKLVEWPAYALHDAQTVYDPRCCAVEDLYGLMLGRYIVHCS